MNRYTLLEIGYLSQEAKALIVSLLASGVKDFDLAVEMAINHLGDGGAFELESVYEKRRDKKCTA